MANVKKLCGVARAGLLPAINDYDYDYDYDYYWEETLNQTDR